MTTSPRNRNQRPTKTSEAASPLFNHPVSPKAEKLSYNWKRGKGKEQPRNLDHLFVNGKRGKMVHRVNHETGQRYVLNQLLDKRKPFDISKALRG